MVVKTVYTTLQKSMIVLAMRRLSSWFSADSQVVLSTFVFFAFSVIIPNNKVFFILSALYVLVIFFTTRNWKLTLAYTLIPLSQFGIGQSYVFNLIPAHILKHPLYPEGRNAYYAFTPFTALAISMILWLVCIGVKKYTSFHWKEAEIVIAFVIILQLLSASQSTFLPHLSLLYALSSVFWLSYILVLRNLFYEGTADISEMVRTTLIALATICILFQSSLAVIQYVKRSPVGLKIEVATELPYFGAGADEDSSQVRPVGLTPHANIFAFELLNLWAFSLLLWIAGDAKRRRKISKVVLLGCAAGTIGVILSQSRSGYLGWLVLLVSFLYVLFHFEKKIFTSVITILRTMKIGIAALIPVATYVAVTRSLYTLQSFNPHAGAGTRSYLLKESTELILKHPLWGVGMSMFIPAAFEQQATQVMSYFPEAVHNGFVLLLVEQGVLVCCGVLLAYGLLFRSIYFLRNTPLSILAYASVFSIWCCMLFQPFSGILPMAVVGIFATRYVSETT